MASRHTRSAHRDRRIRLAPLVFFSIVGLRVCPDIHELARIPPATVITEAPAQRYVDCTGYVPCNAVYGLQLSVESRRLPRIEQCQSLPCRDRGGNFLGSCNNVSIWLPSERPCFMARLVRLDIGTGRGPCGETTVQDRHL